VTVSLTLVPCAKIRKSQAETRRSPRCRGARPARPPSGTESPPAARKPRRLRRLSPQPSAVHSAPVAAPGRGPVFLSASAARRR
jgi:hypothetical protein